MVRIKVCGLTDPGQAREVAYKEADAVGMVFAESPRKITPERAREIVGALPPFVQSVGVFVNENPARIRKILDFAGLDLVQLHGREAVETCKELAPRVIKAWRVKHISDIKALKHYEPFVRAFLLDAWSPEAQGGTGRVFDWEIAVHAVRSLERPVILAGGLNPANVAEAVAEVHPWGLDVSSGVESAPGDKNMDLVVNFIKNARNTDL